MWSIIQTLFRLKITEFSVRSSGVEPVFFWLLKKKIKTILPFIFMPHLPLIAFLAMATLARHSDTHIFNSDFNPQSNTPWDKAYDEDLQTRMYSTTQISVSLKQKRNRIYSNIYLSREDICQWHFIWHFILKGKNKQEVCFRTWSHLCPLSGKWVWLSSHTSNQGSLELPRPLRSRKRVVLPPLGQAVSCSATWTPIQTLWGGNSRSHASKGSHSPDF